MTVKDYEQQGGFRDELARVREISFAITTLEELIPARPHRDAELSALADVKMVVNKLREEILTSRPI